MGDKDKTPTVEVLPLDPVAMAEVFRDTFKHGADKLRHVADVLDELARQLDSIRNLLPQGAKEEKP